MSTENLNLMVMRDAVDKTKAECIKSAPTVLFDTKAWIRAFDSGKCKSGSILRKRKTAGSDTVKMSQKPSLVRAYLDRPNEVGFLSPYEFCCNYELVPVKLSLAMSRKPRKHSHCSLTSAGKINHENGNELIAGVDFTFTDHTSHAWLPLSTHSEIRYKYVLQKRGQPMIPVFSGAPLPRKVDRQTQGRAMAIYFTAWCVHEDLINVGITSNVELASVPGDVAFENLCKKAPSQFMRRTLINFQTVYALREREVLSYMLSCCSYLCM